MVLIGIERFNLFAGMLLAFLPASLDARRHWRWKVY